MKNKTAVIFGQVIALLCVSLFCAGSASAAVGELDVNFSYTSRFVPPLDFHESTGGISAHNPNSCIFESKKAPRALLIEVNPKDHCVYMRLTAGNHVLYNPMSMELSDYVTYAARKNDTQSWIHDMANFSGTKGQSKKSDGVEIPLDFVNIPKPVKSIIGEGGPKITVTGSRKIAFSGKSEWDEDLVNTGTFRQSKFPSLNMEQTSRFKIRGDIGSKIHVEVDQDSQRDVDLANTLKLRYQGEEDEIIQSIEAGNTTLRLPNSDFIGYSENVQGLFGIKATAKVGNVELTMITSQERGSSEKSTFKSGAMPQEQNIFDYNYLHNVYFFLGINLTTQDSLMNVLLYREGTERDQYGLACVDPHYGPGPNETGGVDTIYYSTTEEENRSEFVERYFSLIDEDEYEWYPQGYIVMKTRVDDINGVLAAYIQYAHRNGDTTEIRQEGKLTATPDTLVLKLIRDNEVDSSFTTWDLEWRNVYDLGARDISPDGFELQIYKGIGVIETDTMDQDGVPYIQLFEFDQYNNSNPSQRTPDGIFDFSVTTIDAVRGHLIFPQNQPFASQFLNARNDAIYRYKYGSRNLSDSRKYYIWVKSAKRDNTFSLGRTNIIEGSEVVKTSGGTVLQRGVDYNIVYEIGQITFISERASNLASEVSVDFEYAPFFMPEKKSLFGMSAKYAINDKSFISLAGMYRKETAREFRPRVGREPRRSMIWDSNFLFHFDPNFITTLVDALPLVESDAPSAVEFQGEVAQSLPNPNLRNEAFVDDFEGVKEYTDLVMRRGVWTVSSPPVSMQLANHRRLWWYNPYDQILITSIWPERADFREQDNRQDVLVLEYFPDTSSAGADTAGWAGIMRAMYAGLTDQSRTKFIEIWYLPDSMISRQLDTEGNPKLVVDIGRISEDVDDDNRYDTEDANLNGVFDGDEDTGLDGWDDTEERDSLGMPGVTDPSGDDWHYKTPEERYDYSHINGTEANRNDPDRLNRFDTEDINNNQAFETANSYFQYMVDLNHPQYVEEVTSTGWKLLRIPIQDPTAYTTQGSPDFGTMNYVRLWLTGASRHYTVKLASVQLVGNKWQEMALPDTIYQHGVPVNTKFEVAVKNTQEHAGSYQSPPGVAGEYIRDTGVQEKEQSMVLRYSDLYPGQKVGAYWSMMTLEDYTFYNKLLMYVHGGDNLPTSVPVYFYFRIGTDSSSNYYEQRTRLSPGWTESNYVEMDFSAITALKSYLQSNTHEDSLKAIAIRDSTGCWVVGNPSLSQVKFFVAGIEYDSLTANGDPAPPAPIGGEVWCDELRLTEVRKKSDFAGRMSTTVRLADLADVTASYTRTGADFYKLSDKKPRGTLSTQKTVSSSVNVQKFFPPSWGLTLPVLATWQETEQLPRLKTGSDIILPADLRQKERTYIRTWSVTASERFSMKANNWLVNWTLKRIDTRFVYRREYKTSPVIPVSNTRGYEASGNYDLTPGQKPSFKPFAWTSLLFVPKKLSETKLFFLPTALKYNAKLNGTDTHSMNNRNIFSSSYARDLTLNQVYGFSPFSALKTDLTMSTQRDVSDPKRVNFAIDPRKIELGRERLYSQTFTSSFAPELSRQLKPRFQFSAKYSENSDLARNPDSTRSFQMNTNLRGDMSLELRQFLMIDKILGPDQPKPPEEKKEEELKEPESSEEREEAEKEATEEKAAGKKKGFPSPLKMLKKSLRVFDIIKPVQGSFSVDKRQAKSGLMDRPSWKYLFGFVDETDVRQLQRLGFATADQTMSTNDYSLRSGITPSRILDINASYKIRTSLSQSQNTPIRTKSVEFPSLDATLNNVEKFPFFKKFAKTASIQTGYSKKLDETGNASTGELNKRTVSEIFAPLLGLNLTLAKDIRATMRYEQGRSKSQDLREEGGNQRTDESEDRTIKAGVSYSLTAPRGLNIPIFGKVKFDSQLSLSLDFTKRFTKSWYILAGVKNNAGNRVETIIEPRASYRFSAKITGGLNARWQDSNDKIQKRKHHVRELGIWTELRF